jgi:dethiobiotin synthetase
MTLPAPIHPSGLFITGTGTGIGKTFVTRSLIGALRRRDRTVAALKPLETGCDPDPDDALALAHACRQPDLARAPGLYRAPAPLAPYAATLAGHAAPPPISDLAQTIRHLRDHTRPDHLLVEGAGGLLVPITHESSVADLACALALPLVLVAPDGLGVLSHTLTAYECARARALPIAGVVLSRHTADPSDRSSETNARILAERLDGTPVLTFPRCEDDDEALANVGDAWHLADLLP